MKTRKSVTRVRGGLDDESRSKKTKKCETECQEASYRESHNIGRRKSNESVVTYSLNSHMFFDVYAKFDQNIVCDKNGVIKSPRKSSKKIQSDLSPTKTLPRVIIPEEDSPNQVNGKKEDQNQRIRRSPRKASDGMEQSKSPLKDKIVTEEVNSRESIVGMLPSEENLSEVSLCRNLGRKKLPINNKRKSSKKSSLKAVRLRSVVSENNSTDDSSSYNVNQKMEPNVGRRTSLRRSTTVRTTDVETVQSLRSELVSTDGSNSRRSFHKKLKLSKEVSSVITDESVICSPSLNQRIPLKSPRHNQSSVKKSSLLEDNHSNIIEVPSTNTETFQRLLENKTVFKKHLSKVSLLKKCNIKKKRRESRRINKVVKQVQTAQSKDEVEGNDERVTSIKTQKSKNILNNASILSIRKTRMKKTELLKSVPVREKRIASLNAAAIINCVQSLFENGRRSRSKSSGRGEGVEEEEITLELVQDHVPEDEGQEVMKTEVQSKEYEATVDVELDKETKEKESISNITSKTNNIHKEDLEQKSQNEESVKKESKKDGDCTLNKEVGNDCEAKEKSVIKRKYERFFDITTTASQRVFEKVSLPTKKDKHVEREINNVMEGDKVHNNVYKVRAGVEEQVVKNGKEVREEKMKKDVMKEESLSSKAGESVNERKKVKNNKNDNIIRKMMKKEEKSSHGHKETGGVKHDRKVSMKKHLSKKILKSELNDEKTLLEGEDYESSWLWEGEGEEKLISLQVGCEKVTRLCYPAIKHVKDDVIIRETDCVMLRSVDDQEPYLAKIVTFFFDQDSGKKMMALLWYYRPEHTDQGRLSWHTEADVYASKHLDTNSIDCIEDKAFVLPMEMYSRFLSLQKRQCSSSRQGLSARLVPNFVEDADIIDLDMPQTSSNDVTMGMLASDFYYTSNFQSSFLPDMTTSNVFVCRGLYDIQQHKITKNILQLIQSPVREPQLERCLSVDSAMSISSCNSDSRLIDQHSLLDIPLPPNIKNFAQQSLSSFIDSTTPHITSRVPLSPKSLSLTSLSKSYVPLISQSLSSPKGNVLLSTATNGL